MLQRLRKALGGTDRPTEAHSPPLDRTVVPLARQALLAAISPATGRRWNNNARYVVAAAVLLELAHEGRISVAGAGRKARYRVLDSAPLGDPDLDSALRGLDAGGVGRTVARNVGLLPRDDQVATRLVAEGLLLEGTGRTLGVIPSRRLDPTPAAGRDEVVARVRAALLGESVPDDRTALLLAALLLGTPSKLFVPKDRAKEAARRWLEIVNGIGEDGLAIVSAVAAVRDRNQSDYGSSV
ncbi:GOLPH3/VPS74 family protein [Nocardioides sp. AX2bis]|uniref:GOLPH3/VPS74 family protein n=1 Tax=Nocardioides sp. AX2bis TaxID=2653157 RepID=UPI0012EF659F|nr:GPP34 family phosphoprotein [Nocardioides sp. AX2bis]VXB81146.1 conserved hypothetical protein [Nocardioides sp. AX2bis]